MSLVTASIEIAAPPERVWETVMDPKCLEHWVTIHRRLVRADAGPVKIGYEMEQAIHLRGVTLDVHWELVECKPPRRAVWEGRGPARSRAHTEYLLSDEGGRTRFDYQNEFRAPLGPVGAIVSRALVGGIPQREANRTLQALKEKIEQGQ
jgi:carbon monoxide dehydrogenase subunit G